MMVTRSKSTLVNIAIHVLMWAVFGMLLFFFAPLSWNITVPYQLWIKQTIIISLLVIAYYLNSFVLVPQFLLKNNTLFYLLGVFAATAVIVISNRYVDNWLNLPELMDEAFHKKSPAHHHNHHDWDFGNMAATIGTSALVIGISTSVTAVQKWQFDKQKHQEMEQDRISSELSFLKAQINPHFFFNTLNNIYALTLVDAEVSRKAIHQLSRMMRYVLYDNQNNTTLLSQEIAFIKDYISLMQLRLTDVVKIDFATPSALNDMAVAPMIFLPFVENAFKHGVSATQASNINIYIEQKKSLLELMVVNTIIKEQSNNLEEGSGIGLNNTRRRLDLLYPGAYTLLIDENTAENIYTVHLTLNLS